MTRESFYKILDYLPLNMIILSRTMSTGLQKRIDRYLAQELKIKQLSCGQNHSLVLLENGRVLFIKHQYNDSNSLSELLNIDPVEFICTGFFHSVMLDRMNSIWAMGYNSEQQLPLNLVTKSVTSPQRANSVNHIHYIAANTFTTAVLSYDNHYQIFGQSGLKPRLFENGLRLLPEWVIIPKTLDVIDASAGDAHALILTADGKCYGFGSNENGLLGLGTAILSVEDWRLVSGKQVRQIKSTSLGSIILTKDNILMATGMNVKQQLSVDGDTTIVSFKTIATEVKTFEANDYHTLYLDLSNQLHAMGYIEIQTAGFKKPSPVNLLSQRLQLTGKDPVPPPQSLVIKKIGNLNSFFKFVSANAQPDRVEVLDNSISESLALM